eukprot:TRINITY_DN9975_c0_g1_i3.p1 TRINITY_DN9975_c0_g1~~TRINITY_DN9975_c0_g1_i3.p1  ORF type:complete len:191 (+),score=30.56 TRINITY_DN9975_c0_g1_i3:60-575(+)
MCIRDSSNAYMTSVLFIALTNFLANESKSLETRASKLPIDWTAIDLFRGRIYPYYHFSLADLDNDALEHDPEFNQTVIFFRLLSGNIQQKHLEQLKISNTLGEIEISVSGSSSGFIQFPSVDLAEKFLTSEILLDLKEFQFTSYRDRKRFKAHKLYSSTCLLYTSPSPRDS